MSDELNALAGAYALDALSPDEQLVFEEHLQSCADCAEEVLGMQNAAAELSYIEAVPPPAELRAEVLNAIKVVRPLAPVSNVIPIGRARRSKVATQLLAAACTLIAIVSIGWGVQQHNNANRASQQSHLIQSAIGAADTKAVSGTFGGGSGIAATVIYSKSNRALVMNASGIKTLAADKTYQAWLISKDGTATSLGTFEPTSSGTVSMRARADFADAASVGVTVEPVGGSKTPTLPAETVSL